MRYLSIEMPDEKAIVDFLGEHPVSIRIKLVGDELHICAVSATQDAPILLDEVVNVPKGDPEKD